MVSEITAWRASDGSIHDSKLKAAEQDAVLVLSKLEVFNHASALAVVKHAKQIVDALQPVVWEREAEEVHDA